VETHTVISVPPSYLWGMKIYDTKTIDCAVNGKLRMVSLHELLRLIEAGKTPALTKQGHADLKKLIGLMAQIQIQGDWLLQSPWAIPNPPATGIR
jgi:hypothetical protein